MMQNPEMMSQMMGSLGKALISVTSFIVFV